MLEYFEYFNELINNINNYNLYFAGIRLAQLAIQHNISIYKFYQDIKYLKTLIRSELNSPESAILDIDDAVLAIRDNTLLAYDTNEIIKLMREL